MMILSLGLVALMAAFQHALRLTQLRRNCLTPARELAEQVLANLERGASLATPENNMTWSAEQNRLPCQISTSPWPVVPGLQQVRVAVSWMDHGKPGTVTLTTLLPDTVGAQAHAVNANQ
ncbi:MAG: hypothetical protein ONB49_16920 [candidate division KSB1 bacterium]|nr:hypothetical protein [candidate division KSB1 bacterium]